MTEISVHDLKCNIFVFNTTKVLGLLAVARSLSIFYSSVSRGAGIMCRYYSGVTPAFAHIYYNFATLKPALV